MSLEKLVVVAGISGIHKVAANRSNGLIIESLDTGKKRFAPSRKHQFTPLESITIYVEDGDPVELATVFKSMLSKLEETPIVAEDASNEDLKAYFEQVLPNYDRERVYLGDMKKIVKWFRFLNERSLISLEEESGEEESEENTEEVATENTNE